MSDEKEKVNQPSQVQNDSAAMPSPAADQKITLSLDELKSFMKATVEDVLANSKTSETRKQAEEYNSKIAESVKDSQASIIKPTLANGQKSVDYIKGVLDEDNRRRFQSGEGNLPLYQNRELFLRQIGNALYSDKGEDFVKAKIVLLHKIGLNEEEIAKELADIL